MSISRMLSAFAVLAFALLHCSTSVNSEHAAVKGSDADKDSYAILNGVGPMGWKLIADNTTGPPTIGNTTAANPNETTTKAIEGKVVSNAIIAGFAAGGA